MIIEGLSKDVFSKWWLVVLTLEVKVCRITECMYSFVCSTGDEQRRWVNWPQSPYGFLHTEKIIKNAVQVRKLDEKIFFSTFFNIFWEKSITLGNNLKKKNLLSSICMLTKTKIVMLIPKLQSVIFSSISRFSPQLKQNSTDQWRNKI